MQTVPHGFATSHATLWFGKTSKIFICLKIAAVETLQKTLAIQSAYWETLKSRSPESALLSHMEAWQKERAEASTSGAVVRSASDETESPVGPTSLVSTEVHGL